MSKNFQNCKEKDNKTPLKEARVVSVNLVVFEESVVGAVLASELSWSQCLVLQ